MTDRYLCIHGHFYQPPRENPWIGFIETQPTARPFHDWNERITRECYTPNGWSRLLGEGGRVGRLIDNYEYMSFNFGPTLLSWLEKKHPRTHARLQKADRESARRRGGHGNALAQVFNHIIMPLANRRDKLTQIRWGRADFLRRFGREPEGMWLAETAVDAETLDLLAGEGLRFVILAPDQAKAVRPLGETDPGAWVDVSGGRVDPRRPYRYRIDGRPDRFIDVFFYDGPVSRAIAYERLLASGSGFLARIEAAFGEPNGGPRLVNLATDGESYGHHFQFGDMALSWIIGQLENGDRIRLTNYGEFLEISPPVHEVRIVENSSWSCAHGVERWRSDCGCHVGGDTGWNQKWRGPLRDGFDRLRDRLAGLFEKEGAGLFSDPWAARDGYARVLIDPTAETRESFFKQYAARPLSEEERSRALRLLESQVMALYMFTSCGWFFDDVAGLEPIQDMMYAARAMDLVRPLTDADLEGELTAILARAQANDPDYETGADVWREEVVPARLNPGRIAAHFVMTRLVDDASREECPAARLVTPLSNRRFTQMGISVMAGRAEVLDPFILSRTEVSYFGLHAGGADLVCLVSRDPLDVGAISEAIQQALEEADTNRLRDMAQQAMPGAESYGLQDLILDTRNRLLRRLARGFFDDLGAWIQAHYEIHKDVLSLFRESGQPVPEAENFLFRNVVSEELDRLLTEGREPGALDMAGIRALAKRAQAWGVEPNRPWINARISEFLRYRFQLLAEDPREEGLNELTAFLLQARLARRNLELWESQNIYDGLRRDPAFTGRLTEKMKTRFKRLGRELGFISEAE